MDMIDRQAAIDVLYEFAGCIVDTPNGDYQKAYQAYRHRLEMLPSAEPERKTGRWVPILSQNNTYKCSECGRLLANIIDGKYKVAKHYPYCHCGAKMEVEQDG